MEQYIPKSALLAEIEKIRCKVDDGSSYCNGWQHALRTFEIGINNLEVKEVDFEKEAELIANGIMISVQANKYGTNIYNTERNDFNHHHLQMAARKGIELGLNTQQNINIDITNIDKVIEENGVDPNSKEAKIFKESYYIALEKLKYRKENNHDTRRKALKGS